MSKLNSSLVITTGSSCLIKLNSPVGDLSQNELDETGSFYEIKPGRSSSSPSRPTTPSLDPENLNFPRGLRRFFMPLKMNVKKELLEETRAAIQTLRIMGKKVLWSNLSSLETESLPVSLEVTAVTVVMTRDFILAFQRVLNSHFGKEDVCIYHPNQDPCRI